MAALCGALVGAGVAGYGGDSPEDWNLLASASKTVDVGPLSAIEKIRVAGHSVNVSCSGAAADGKPVIVLMLGGGDGLEKMAALQTRLSKKNRVCSYDRLGEGASDKPDGLRSIADAGKILTGVLNRVAGDGPVVLAGHSLGGLIAARYAPHHRDRVKGLVLMDATPPTWSRDLARAIPASATGPAAEFRARNLEVVRGKNPEQLVIPDGKVRSAGKIPVEVIKHGKPEFASIPKYGPRMERVWAAGQRKWLALSGKSRLSTAKKSGHYIYVDQPDLAIRAIQRVTSQATRRSYGR